jgi:methylglutaconyl-CoA hydratase
VPRAACRVPRQGAAGAVLAPRLLGVPRAKELIFTARRFSGEEANEWGVVQHCAPFDSDGALAHATRLATTIAANGPLGVRGAKAVLNATDDGLSFAEHLALSNERRFPLNETADFEEALKAFAEKRKPVFRGE